MKSSENVEEECEMKRIRMEDKRTGRQSGAQQTEYQWKTNEKSSLFVSISYRIAFLRHFSHLFG